MADLVMTIDSDSDAEVTTKNKKKQANKSDKPSKKGAEQDEEILLAHSVILQDT